MWVSARRIESAKEPGELECSEGLVKSRFLGLHTEHAANLLAVALRVQTAHTHIALVGTHRTRYASDGRGLACAVAAHKSDDLAWREGKIKMVHGHGVAVRFAQSAHVNCVHTVDGTDQT